MQSSSSSLFAPLTRSFSLNEAARIRRQCLDTAHEPECPRCGSLLKVLEGGDAEQVFELVTCSYCSVSLMLPLPNPA